MFAMITFFRSARRSLSTSICCFNFWMAACRSLRLWYSNELVSFAACTW